MKTAAETKISELKKGDIIEMKNIGEMTVIGKAKNYITLKNDSMKMRIQFNSNEAPISSLGIPNIIKAS